jgi:flagellar hook-basal body complex protein FliE
MRLELLDANFVPKNITESNDPRVSSGSFIEYLNNALQDVDRLQVEASAGAQKMALGDEEFLHNTVPGIPTGLTVVWVLASSVMD